MLYDMLSGECGFIDHASGYLSIKHQVVINSNETFKEKLTFDREDQSQGVVINRYHTDSGISNDLEFIDDMLKNKKKIMFSGAGASHQNGAAECNIKTVVTMAITLLVQAALRYPEDTFFTDICPMAMDYALWVNNWIPDMQSRLSNIEIWSR